MLKNPSIFFVSFLQAAGLVIYISLVAAFMTNAQKWFSAIGPFFWGPVIWLSLFSLSALICTLIVGTYPLWIFWEKKQTIKALKIIIATAAWFLLFLALLLSKLLITK